MLKHLIVSIQFSVLIAGVEGLSAAPSRQDDSLEEILSQLPNRELSLDFILIAAMNYADSFQAIKTGLARKKIPERNARAPLDPRLRVSGGYLYDETERSNSFEPQSIKAGRGVVGLDVPLSTGTYLSLEVEQSKNRVALPSSVIRYWETKGALGIRQSLLKDSFGWATRNAIEASRHQATAIESESLVSAEEFLLSIIDQFHQAWLSQRRLTTSEENLARRKKLLQGVRARLSRGAASEADFLQAESALLNAEVQLDQARLDLAEIWRSLILVLKLDQRFLEVDPLKIPLPLEDSFSEAEKLCKTLSVEEIYKRDAKVLRAEGLRKSAEALRAAARNRFLPQLDVVGKMGVGNNDGSFGTPIGDSLMGENPEWSVGVEFSIPLAHRRERADLLEAEIQSRQAVSFFETAKTESVVRWRDACDQVSVDATRVKALEEIVKKQKRREVLENNRFQVGSVGVFAVVQAGDDLAGVEASWREAQVRLRREAWTIARMSGGLRALLEKANAKL